MKKFYSLAPLLVVVALFLITCKKKSDDPQPLASSQITTSCTDVNVFSLQRDIALGAQVDAQIRNTPAQYKVLDSANNSQAYQFLYALRDSIFNKANIDHEKDFKWRIAIIDDTATLNAFCTPGGYIFIYTGIIKYLDSEDDLAGVLGHEMGHAALRHSTDALLKLNGLNILLDALGGTSSTLTNIAKQLVTLKYSRCHETQADEFSVIALQDTRYKCDSAADFFKKLLVTGSGSKTPTFLSDHPGDADRVTNIESKAAALGCSTKVTKDHAVEWKTFKTSLGFN